MVLAAGGSTRMGRAKPLLELRGETLIHRATREALAAGLGPVVVVVGSEGERVRAAIQDLDARAVGNPRWEEGMGTSIERGVSEVAEDQSVEAVVIMLADQVRVDRLTLRALAAAWNGHDIVASTYGESVGVPALFARGLFERLRTLPPPAGAKQLLREPGFRIAAVEVPEGAIDFDTPEDVRRFGGEDHLEHRA